MNNLKMTPEEIARAKAIIAKHKKHTPTKIEIEKNGVAADLSCCPHCRSNSGYYRNVRISGETICNYNYDGSDDLNEHIHDHLKYREQKTMFCKDCKQPIGYAK